LLSVIAVAKETTRSFLTFYLLSDKDKKKCLTQKRGYFFIVKKRNGCEEESLQKLVSIHKGQIA
jgi:hypothetical protein